MIRFDNFEFEEKTLIEICATPDRITNCYIFENIIQNSDRKITVLDTKGNIKLLVDNLELEDVTVNNVFTFEEFLDFLINITIEKDSILFIDTLTYIVDIRYEYDPCNLKKVFNILWDIIYSKEVTIFVLNHFLFKRDGGCDMHIPRMGKLWEKIISYRLFLEFENGKIFKSLEVKDKI